MSKVGKHHQTRTMMEKGGTGDKKSSILVDVLCKCPLTNCVVSESLTHTQALTLQTLIKSLMLKQMSSYNMLERPYKYKKVRMLVMSTNLTSHHFYPSVPLVFGYAAAVVL